MRQRTIRTISTPSPAEEVVKELQAVLKKHHAALFFSNENTGELWINGHCAAHVTHGDDCELAIESICTKEETK